MDSIDILMEHKLQRELKSAEWVVRTVKEPFRMLRTMYAKTNKNGQPLICRIASEQNKI